MQPMACKGLAGRGSSNLSDSGADRQRRTQTMVGQVDPKSYPRLARAAFAAAVCAGGIALLSLAGWALGRPALTRVLPGEAAAGAKAVSGPAYTIVDQPISSPADIANSALVIYRELRNKLNNRLTASGSTIGDPRIRANAVIRLEGLGPDFSGNYTVKSAVHTIDAGGYRTSFEARKEILP